MDESSIVKVLEYGKSLYETGRYDEAKQILNGLSVMCLKNKKVISAAILALWIVFSVNILTNSNAESLTTFGELSYSIQLLKESLDEDVRKINFDSVKI